MDGRLNQIEYSSQQLYRFTTEMDARLVGIQGNVHICDEHVKALLMSVTKYEDLFVGKNSKIDENSVEKTVDGL